MKTKICIICKKEKELNQYDKKRKWYLNYCKECRKIKRKEYYKNNREKEIKYARKYQENNKEHLKQVNIEYRKNNKNKLIEYNKNWYKKNKIKRRKYDNELKKNKRKNDKIFNLKCKTRTIINTSFKRKKYTKKNKIQKILDCNYNFFINYLLKTFKNNYGYEWDGKEKVHIDHIIPLSTAKTEEDVIKLCHYTNLQLLKAHDNLTKSNKLNWELKK